MEVGDRDYIICINTSPSGVDPFLVALIILQLSIDYYLE